ncbi:hypothetical protein L6R29_22470 [Myxococcota bacterium]|nr:hypothetical protein [Myxococcota bacterium]
MKNLRSLRRGGVKGAALRKRGWGETPQNKSNSVSPILFLGWRRVSCLRAEVAIGITKVRNLFAVVLTCVKPLVCRFLCIGVALC